MEVANRFLSETANLPLQIEDTLSSPRLLSEFSANEMRYMVVAIENQLEEHHVENVLNSFFQEQEIFEFSRVDDFQVNNCFCFVVEVPDEVTPPQPNLAEILTARELQVAALVAKGHPNKQIAKHLRISEWTVATHLRRVFAKLNVDSRAAMVYRCAGCIQNVDLEKLQAQSS
ncbi:MAG: helix-turn-helix transcriptional regulator [Cyanobacteria bacterium P01_D01_bin.6]